MLGFREPRQASTNNLPLSKVGQRAMASEVLLDMELTTYAEYVALRYLIWPPGDQEGRLKYAERRCTETPNTKTLNPKP